MSAKQIVLASRPKAHVQPNDFRLEEFELPSLNPGQTLLRVQFLSLDPYMRPRMDDRKSYAKATAVEEVMPGECVATVLESRHADFVPGETVLAFAGWRTHCVLRGDALRKVGPCPFPVTTRLGVLGMPGFTAYAGLYLIGKPKPGDTVAVAAATGPVGSMVGQLARIAGAKAVGITSGPEKCSYARNELRFDVVVDRRAANFPAALAKACPKGFENVGGGVWQAVLPLLNAFARIPVCGLIAHYDSKPAEGRDQLPETMRAILTKSLMVRGFINYEFSNEHYGDFLRDVSGWLAEGRIRYREDIVDGLENAPQAFIGMLKGQNFGKLIIRVGDPGTSMPR
ncbi:MAG TPA: NADP-dependent oxidoreductase [Terriglobales bacterium]|nr:NADP-dependent oxidoreductase [Terriglobales bacterium]